MTDERLNARISLFQQETEFATHQYTLGPGKGDESISVERRPTRVQVDIQDGYTVTYRYAVPRSCDRPEININLGSETATVNNGCVSIASTLNL